MAPKLRMSAAELADHIGTAISVQASFEVMPVASEEDLSELRSSVAAWDARNALLLEQAFTRVGFGQSSPRTDYVSAMGLKIPFPAIATGEESIADLIADSRTKADRLRRLLANLDLYEAEDRVMGAETPNETSSPVKQNVFIVHGHDMAAVNQVNLLIRQTSDLDVTILGDQSSRGQTVIEKLEVHLGDRSSFAVVLMTADDLGRALHEAEDKPRARQNVIFELGYALAALGRSNVAALYQPGVEMPSDFSGVVYIAFDENGIWKHLLLKELREAGLPVDANRL
ncbi:nucleotide-binding protein (plasmid) [Arthrobacter sp. YA7-1]|uniref:nucleotide-binding protein n=1 Tax=Arthrobacter sp. YA7-1 TaxID=2987701 RepID=UPI002226ADC2|nr:nucleotide-binding protein [Arthrobacter sp. YA7-1]UYY83679.1 nucleotide-binding protein [Arthrobacter sp. YA7-1]